MATMLPVALKAIAVLQTASTVAKVIGRGADVLSDRDEKQADQALAQLQARQDAQYRDTQERATLSRQEISAKAAEVEDKRRLSLKRAVARQRAKYGAAGVSSGDGSSEAVLLGLFDESDEERTARERLDNIRLQSLDQNLANQNRINTLERTQLRERSNLKNSSSTLEEVTDLLSIF